MVKRGDEVAQSMFEKAFAELEIRCFRDAKHLRKFKQFVWGKIRSMHNITHLEIEDCVQIVMGILDKGCVAYYRGQLVELQEYRDDPERASRPRRFCALLSTFIVRHVNNKYNSFMTQFFAPIRAFESCRLRTEEQIIIRRDAKGEPVYKTVPGTILLSRFDVDDPSSPSGLIEDERPYAQPNLMLLLQEFKQSHKGVISLINRLQDADVRKADAVQSIQPVAQNFGLTTKEFVKAIRGLFGDGNKPIQDVGLDSQRAQMA